MMPVSRLIFSEENMKKFFGIVVAVVALCLLCTSVFAGPVSGKLTPDEIKRIKAGEVILKNDIQDGKKSGSGVAYGAFKGSLDRFWEVVMDYPNYQDFFPKIKSAEIIKKDPDKFLTRFKMDVGLTTLEYVSWNKLAADKLRMDFGLDDAYPHKFQKTMNGYWLLELSDDGYILAEYKIGLSLNVPKIFEGAVNGIVNSMAGKDLPQVFTCITNRMKDNNWKLQ